MDILTNPFKQALRAGKPQIALWAALTHPYAAEICAGAGFDCLVIDGEHAPNELQSMLAQLQAVAAYPVAPIVRPPWNDFVRIKQILDIGAQNLLIPMIQSADEAAAAIAAVRYPPAGIRGVGSVLARSSRWNRIPNYLTRANDQMCVLLQIETPAGLAELDRILDVDGVDGVFIGPADLSANMGHLDNPGHPEVTAAIDDAIRRIVASGKSAGILHTNPERARHYLSLGATFVAVGIDATLLARAAESLAAHFGRGIQAAPARAQHGPY